MTKRPTRKATKKMTEARNLHKARKAAGPKTRAHNRKAALKAKSPDVFDRYVDAAAAALDLPLQPEWRAAVKTNFEIILEQGALFSDFDLPDEAEPAPVFKA